MQCGGHSPLSPQPMWGRFNCPYHTFGKVQFARPNHNTWAESVVGLPPRVYLWVVNTLNFNFNLKTVNRESSLWKWWSWTPVNYFCMLKFWYLWFCVYTAFTAVELPQKHLASQVVFEKYIKWSFKNLNGKHLEQNTWVL